LGVGEVEGSCDVKNNKNEDGMFVAQERNHEKLREISKTFLDAHGAFFMAGYHLIIEYG
jgi:hypothetical protein